MLKCIHQGVCCLSSEISQGSTGLRYRIWQGTTTVTGRLKKLWNTITTDSELIKMAVYLSSDSASFVMEMLEYITTQYEEYVEMQTFNPKEAVSTVLDSVALIFEELQSVRSEVIDAGQHNPGMFMWGFLKAWEIQERYRKNQFKDDPALTGQLVRRMVVRDGESSLKEKLKLLDSHESKLESLTARINKYHKESIVFGKKVNAGAPNDTSPNEPAYP
jgi:uncharacterized protein YneF (UPF0154 family)